MSGQIRTAGIPLRRRTLYPTEVHPHKHINNQKICYTALQSKVSITYSFIKNNYNCNFSSLILFPIVAQRNKPKKSSFYCRPSSFMRSSNFFNIHSLIKFFNQCLIFLFAPSNTHIF